MVAEREATEIHGYCLACKDSRRIVNAELHEQRANGNSVRLAHRGNCSECGKPINTIGFGAVAKPMPELELEKPAPLPEHDRCPREVDGMVCGGLLKWDSDYYGHFYLCLTCGWTAEAPGPEREVKGITYIARYNGDCAALSEMVVALTATRATTALAYAATCPWCGERMRQTALSGKRKHKNEGRFLCDTGHRISLFEHADRFTWR